MTQNMEHTPIFDAKDQGTDVFMKLDYVTKEQMHFDELLVSFEYPDLLGEI